MDDKAPEVNMVVYLAAHTPTSDKKKVFSLGAHAYTYDRLKEGKKKLAKDVPTSTGYYTGNPNKPNTVVVVEDIISGSVPYAKSQVEALLTGLQLFLKHAIQNNHINLWIITLHKGLEMLTKVTPNKDGAYVVGKYTLNLEEVEAVGEVQSSLTAFKAQGGNLFFDFTGAAEGGLGNRMAQKQLDLALVNYSVFKDPEAALEVMTRKEFENPENDFNKMVSATRWFFDTHVPEEFFVERDGYRVYDFGRVEKDKNYYGKITPDVTYSKLFTKRPIELLDKLFNFMVKHVKNNDGYLSAGDLSYVTSKDVARMLEKAPGLPVKHQIVSPFLNQGGERPVMLELIKPTLMAYRIRDTLFALDIIFEAWQKKDEHGVAGYSTFYDITDRIFVKETNAKGVVKLKVNPEYTQLTTAFKVPVKHPKAVKDVVIMLLVGYDIPERNSFSSVEDPDVKVWAVTDTRNDQGLRYATVVETNEFVYVHSSASANLRVLTLAELGRKA